MSAQADLFGIYESWREWTEVERRAIEVSDWRLMETCHEAKLKLQRTIVNLTEMAQDEWKSSGLDRVALERELRSVVAELIQMETRNSESLATKQQTAQKHRDELDRSRFSLRNVQRSYAVAMEPAWQSFS